MLNQQINGGSCSRSRVVATSLLHARLNVETESISGRMVPNYLQKLRRTLLKGPICYCEIKTNVQKMTQQKDGLYFAGVLVALTICALCYAAKPVAAVSADQFPDAAYFLLGTLTRCNAAVDHSLSSTSVERPFLPYEVQADLEAWECSIIIPNCCQRGANQDSKPSFHGLTLTHSQNFPKSRDGGAQAHGHRTAVRPPMRLRNSYSGPLRSK